MPFGSDQLQPAGTVVRYCFRRLRKRDAVRNLRERGDLRFGYLQSGLHTFDLRGTGIQLRFSK